MDIILKYFPDLTETQKEQFAALYDLYTDWNSKINVISRKDITNLYDIMCFTRWALPSLSSSSREHVSWTWAREVVFRAYRLLFYSPTQRFTW